MRASQLTASALAAVLLLTGCGTNPYIFSTKLNPRSDAANGTNPTRQGKELAGGLDVALAGLMDQRQLLWEAAGDTEKMKNLTALGLIGLGAVGAYKALDSETHKIWLRKAGLGAAAIYGGATWLEPSARQRIYLEGAKSLSCLAMATAALEIPVEDFVETKKQIVKARGALEQVYSELRLLGSPPRDTPIAKIVNAGWRKASIASTWLAQADKALGNIEGAGTRLRDMTALTAGEVAHQVSLVSRDLSQLPDAIKALKPNANLLLGEQLFPPAEGAGADDEKPVAAVNPAGSATPNPAAASCGHDESPKGETEAGREAGALEGKKEGEAAGRKEGEAAGLAAGRKAASEVAAAAAAASQPVSERALIEAAAKAGAKAGQIEGGKAGADKGAKAGEAAGAQAKVQRSHAIGVQYLGAVKTPELAPLRDALTALSEPLGHAINFVNRFNSARERLGQAPEACGAPPKVVQLFPDTRSIALQPGASFQYLLTGDEGRPLVQYLTVVPPSDVLDISVPALQASTAIRLTAGSKINTTFDTVVRITDSKQSVTPFNISVKVCASPPAAKASDSGK